ncbi:MAG: hypothetical protein AB7I27_10445 [Bacteriovoracaceae bacterium]
MKFFTLALMLLNFQVFAADECSMNEFSLKLNPNSEKSCFDFGLENTYIFNLCTSPDNEPSGSFTSLEGDTHFLWQENGMWVGKEQTLDFGTGKVTQKVLSFDMISNTFQITVVVAKRNTLISKTVCSGTLNLISTDSLK